MPIRIALTHTTRYDYDRAITLSPQVIRLRPAPHNRTPLHSYSLIVSPSDHFLNWQQDPQGNFIARVVFPEKVKHFEIKVDVVADLAPYNPFDFFTETYADEFPFKYAPEMHAELEPYLELPSLGPKLIAFIERLDKSKRRTVDFLVDANRAAHEAVKYLIRLEPGVQTPEQTLTLGSGSCRDSAWLLVQVLRQLGIASRFVSGYLIQLKADVVPLDGPKGPSADFTDLHAWCECYVPGAGWIGLDPTSGLLAAEGHIPLACTPEPSRAAPIEGAAEKAETEFNFDMTLERVIDRPRITKPFSDDAWARLLALGNKVDDAMERGDVRLTMGGEPTFVSSAEPDKPEWNTEALGGKKRDIGDRLLRKLQRAWAPGGMLYHGQGKWYPGEQLPRWTLACYYRTDSVPLWKNPKLFAESGTNLGHTAADAERFARELVAQLGLTRHGLMPAYEDVWYYLWRERRLPSNVDPLDARLDDPIERERLRRVFEQGVQRTVGWVLPLGYDGAWSSGQWFLRTEHCLLLPGDSPIGFRLPLDSLPWVSAEQELGVVTRDPTVSQPPLPAGYHFPLSAAAERPVTLRQQLRNFVDVEDEPVSKLAPHPGHHHEPRKGRASLGRTAESPFTQPAAFESATGLVRTALCVEPRDGCLHVFLPPLPTLEAFAELVAALEVCAERTKLPIQIEGYPPVRDPRLQVFQVTPDPGVIEVNVPPVRRFSEFVEQSATLYHLAEEEKLSAEKFDLDGTHIGSGGGNHVVVGGATTLDSPFLRRPDLLASLLSYFINHPSLSYLFSGRFIGPTSQAPRLDEGRHESTYELEIALKTLKSSEHTPPWLVDRLFRHLLVDVTGNTHRSEFCVDKMYSPDGTTGRLGLLELRGFEMPPHPKMAAAQALLVRALIAAFWQRPYDKPLAKWGTVLHDKFLLPHFVKHDFCDVLADLERWGYTMPWEWFEAQYQFRFPYYGSIVKDNIELELRGAIEPWHVLGEEATAGGQSRFVDSSVERVEVRLTNILGGRYTACCNGVELPLHPTGVKGEAVAGIRYRAWKPPSCLHPTIGVHAPLHFDIYDRHNQRAIAGCTYHVVHRGGLAAEVRPVNAVAAESRRIARFEDIGHTQGVYEPRRAGVNPDYPMTLDLRRV